ASELCERFGRQLEVHANLYDIPDVLEAWVGEDPPNELSRTQRDALEQVSEWRAMLDYAGELVPICAPPSARGACAELARRSNAAPPKAVVDGMKQLSKA